jgi:hypothetical protein
MAQSARSPTLMDNRLSNVSTVRTSLPGWVLPIILVRTWIFFPFRHMDIQERPIVGFGSLKDFIQGSLGAYLDGGIHSFSAHVGLQPLYSKHMQYAEK